MNTEFLNLDILNFIGNFLTTNVYGLVDVSFISAIVLIAVNFYKLNSEIKFIKKVVIKITEKLKIEILEIKK